MEPTSTVEDSFAATRLLQRAGVAAIGVLGVVGARANLLSFGRFENADGFAAALA
jgi:hypothetical protein